jgi:two-component system response regulator YesN
MHETLAGEKPHTFTVGVSTVIKGMKEVSKAYYEAVSALNFKLTLGNNHVIFNEHLVNTEKHVPYPLAIEKKLCSSLNLGDREAIRTHLKEFQTYIYDNIPNSSETVRLFFLQLFTSSLKNMYELDAYPSLVSGIGHMSYTGLLQQETIEGMNGYMTGLYDEILSYMETKRGQIHKEKMEAVSEYIRQHLSTDLKLERIAEQFYFSSSYLRKLFKDEYGLTLKEFIFNERITLAKRLLEDPVLTISNIAEQVGYMSVTSFSKAFKSGTGTTPGEYRTRLLRRNFP